MNLFDWLVLALVSAAFVAAVVIGIRRSKKGGCCGDCSRCGGRCPSRKKED